MIKTTQKQFKLFCDEFKRQVIRMGLVEWRLDFAHEECSDRFLAEICTSRCNRTVSIYFTTQTYRPLTNKFILETAKHEAIELMVDDAFVLAQSPFKTRDELLSVRHTLVRRLEKLL